MHIADGLDQIPSNLDLAGADIVFPQQDLLREQILLNILDDIKDSLTTIYSSTRLRLSDL